MSVQMDRMPHHRHVVESQMHAFTRGGDDRDVAAPNLPVDGPKVGLH